MAKDTENSLAVSSTNIQQLIKALTQFSQGTESIDMSGIIEQIKAFNAGAKELTKTLNSTTKALQGLSASSQQLKTTVSDVKSLQKELTALSAIKLTGSSKQIDSLVKKINTMLESVQKLSSTNSLGTLDLTSQMQSLKNVLELAKSAQKAFANMDLTKSFPNLDAFLQSLKQLKVSFDSIAQSGQQLQATSQSVKDLSNAFKTVKSSVNEFQKLSETIQNLSPTNLNTLMTPLNRMVNLADRLNKAFASLGEKNVNFSELTASLTNLSEMYTSLISLVEQYQLLIQNLKVPIDVSQLNQIQAAFTQILSTAQSLGIAFGMYNSLSENFEHLITSLGRVYSVISSLNESFQLFKTLIENADGVKLSAEVQSAFLNIINTIDTLNTVFNSSPLMTALPNIYDQLTQISQIIGSMSSTIQNFSRMGSFTINVESFKNVSNNMIQIVEVIRQLDSQTASLGNVAEKMLQISNAVKSLNTTSKNIIKITDRIGDPEKLTQMKQYMTELGSATASFINELSKVDTSTANLEKITELLKSMSSAFTAMAQSQRTLNQSQSRLTSSVNSFNTSMNQLGTSSTKGLNAFNIGVGNAIKSLTFMNTVTAKASYSLHGLMALLGGKMAYNWLLDSNAYIEDLNTSLTVTLKSAEKAESVIRSMRSYAALTPFNETEVFSGAEMLASNRMDIERWIKVAGDLASAKKVQGTELNDVVNVLTRINSGDFGKAMIRLRQMGISIKDLKEKGLEFSKNNTFLGTTDEMLEAVEQIIENRFGGLTESLSTTFNGVKSNIEDIVYMLGVDLGEEPFEKIKNAMISLQDMLQNIKLTDSKSFFDFDFYDAKKEIAQIYDYVEGLVKKLISAGSVLSKFLGSADKFLKIFVSINISKALLGIISNIQVVGNNFSLITKSTLQANQQLAEGEAQLNTSNLQLSRMERLTASINALRLAGTSALTKDTALLAAQQQMLAVGANRKSFDVINASAAMGLNGYGINSGKVTDGDSKALPVGNAFSAALGKVMVGITLFTVAAAGLNSVLESLNDKKGPSISVKDLETQISNINEEKNKLEELNSTRAYAADNVKLYSQALKEAQDSSDGSAEAMEHENYIASLLQDSKQNLTRADEQLVRMCPELIDSMYDENGQLTDLTDGYDKNTEAILKNIDAKKLLASQKYYYQKDVAEYDNNELKDQENLNNLKLSVYEQMQNGQGVSFGDAVKASTFGVFDKLFSVVQQDDLMENLLKTFTKSDESATRLQAILDSAYHKNDIGQYALDAKISNQEIKEQMNSNDEIINRDSRMKELGFYDFDENGHLQYDNEGNVRLDVDGYLKYLDEQQEKIDNANKEIEGTTTRLQEEYENIYTDYDNLEKEWELKYQKALNEAGGDKDASAVKLVEQQMTEALNGALDDGLETLQEIYDTNTGCLYEKIQELSPALQQLAEAGVSKEIIYDYLLQYREKGIEALDGLKEYSDLIVQVYDDFEKKNIDLSYSLELMRKYEQVEEVKKTMDEYRTQIETDKYKNSNKLLDSNSSSKKSSKSAYQIFKSEWEDKTEIAEMNNELELQRLQIQGYDEDSGTYRAREKQLNMQMVQQYQSQINALKKFISSGNFKDSDEARQAQIDLLKLQKEQNQLLIDIKKNTDSMLGEFNVPGEMKAMTLYDYRAREANGYQVQVGNAEFVLKIDKVETQQDAENAVKLIYQQLNPNRLSATEYSGVTRPDVYR